MNIGGNIAAITPVIFANDIFGILKVRGTLLDMEYLRTWATQLHVTDLLERTLVDAGLTES